MATLAPIPDSAILPGLSPSARALFLLLQSERLMPLDCAHALAQAVASSPTKHLSAEQVLLCVVSDYMAPLIRTDGDLKLLKLLSRQNRR